MIRLDIIRRQDFLIIEMFHIKISYFGRAFAVPGNRPFFQKAEQAIRIKRYVITVLTLGMPVSGKEQKIYPEQDIFISRLKENPVNVTDLIAKFKTKAGIIGKADVLDRPLLADPDYTNKLRAGREDEIRPCLGCQDGCFGRLLRHGIASCAVNPECGRETYVGIRKADVLKKIVIVGGGPAGLEAARVSALCGHDVTLIEAASKLGGALRVGCVPDFKVDDRRLIAYYELQFEYPLVYKLGDSRHVSNILHAVWDGYEVARNL